MWEPSSPWHVPPSCQPMVVPLQWELSLGSGESKKLLGGETAEGELEKHPAGSEQWSPAPILCLRCSRSCFEGEHRGFTTCCGPCALLGAPPEVMGCYWEGPAQAPEYLLSMDVSNPLVNRLVPFTFAASHGRDFQMFATSHALACFKLIFPSIPECSLVLALRALVNSSSMLTLPITFMVLWTLYISPQPSLL